MKLNKNTYLILGVIAVLIVLLFVYVNSKSTKTGLPNTANLQEPAVIEIESLTNKTGGEAAAVLSGEKTVTWKTSNYPSTAGININIIRKTSDSPSTFKFVRSIVVDSQNDGTESWLPAKNEKGDDVYVEVTCSNTFQFQNGCQLSRQPIKIN